MTAAVVLLLTRPWQARSDHTHYFTIIGLLTAITTFIITAINRANADKWYNGFLGAAFVLEVLSICGVVWASFTNYQNNYRGKRRDCHLLFHVLLFCAVVLTAIAVLYSMFTDVAMKAS